MQRSSIITIIVLLALLFLAAAYTWYAQQKAEDRAKENSLAGIALRGETNNFTSLSGEPIALDSLEKVTVAYVWASWCPQCKSELETLSELAADYESNETPVRIVAINRQEPAVTAERFLATVEYNNALEIVIDTEDSFYNSIDAYAMPELIIFDTKGNEILRQRGAIKLQDTKEAVKQTLQAESS